MLYRLLWVDVGSTGVEPCFSQLMARTETAGGVESGCRGLPTSKQRCWGGGCSCSVLLGSLVCNGFDPPQAQLVSYRLRRSRCCLLLLFLVVVCSVLNYPGVGTIRTCLNYPGVGTILTCLNTQAWGRSGNKFVIDSKMFLGFDPPGAQLVSYRLRRSRCCLLWCGASTCGCVRDGVDTVPRRFLTGGQSPI